MGKLMLFGMLFAACAYENEEELFGENLCDPQTTTYSGVIQGIIASNCAISGCHDGSISPDLTTFNTIQSRASRIKARTANGSMPRGRTLTQTEIDLIACWVDDGALEN